MVGHDCELVDGFLRVHMQHLVDFDVTFWDRFMDLIALRLYGLLDWRMSGRQIMIKE